MKNSRLRFAVYLLVLTAVSLAASRVAFAQQQTAKRGHWHRYVDHRYGFSVWYPDSYELVRSVSSDDSSRYRPCEKGLVVLARRDDPEAKIWVTLDLRRFDLRTISQSHATTGYDPEVEPPSRHIGTHTFYGYGAGGGGVDYPDEFFVNLRGKILGFTFDGPYAGKSPNKQTREIETKLLKTFRVR